MNGFINIFRHDRIVSASGMLSILLIILSLVLIGFFYIALPPVLPLFNQLPWGEARLGAREQIWLVPGIAFIIFLFNMILSRILYGKVPHVARMTSITSALIAVLGFVFLVRTLQFLL